MKYLVKIWEDDYCRDQGISDIEGTDLSLENALDLCKETVDSGLAVVAEVLTEDEEQCLVTYEAENSDTSNKLFVELCKECIDNLKEHNPYTHEDNSPVSLDEMILIKVDVKDCNNHNKNLEIKNGIWKYI